MPLFFVLSGYVLALRYVEPLGSPSARDVVQFLVLRLGRVYPVHFVTLLVCVAIFARHGFPSDDGHSAAKLVSDLLLTQSWSRSFSMSWNFPAWSISSEWFAYLIFPAVAVFASRASRGAMVALLVMCCAASAYVYHFADHPFRALVQVVPTFVGGVALARLLPPGSADRPALKWGAIGLLGLAAVVPFLLPLTDASPVLVVLFFGVVALLGAAGYRNLAVWSWRPLAWLGDVSYSLYMVHELVLGLLVRVIGTERLNRAGTPVRALAVVGILGAVIALALAMYTVVEKPCRDASRRLLTRKRAVSA